MTLSVPCRQTAVWEETLDRADLAGKSEEVGHSMNFAATVHLDSHLKLTVNFLRRPDPDHLPPPGFEDDMFM